MRNETDLVGALEPNQVVAAAKRPYPRRVLGRGVLALLVALRVHVLIAIVAYAFIHALSTPRKAGVRFRRRTRHDFRSSWKGRAIKKIKTVVSP